MKKSIFLMMLVIVFVGCKPKQPVTSTKLDYKSSTLMKGSWKITAVTFPGSDYIKINSFNLADSQCFVGSIWNLIPNNNKGDLALSKPSCPSFSSPLTWYLNKEGNFVLKILNDTKAKKVTEGYILTIANQTERSFQLMDKANVGAQTVQVVYQFEKLN